MTYTNCIHKEYRAVEMYSQHLKTAGIFLGMAMLSFLIAVGIYLQVSIVTGILRVIPIMIATLFVFGSLRMIWHFVQLLRTALFLLSVEVEKGRGLVVNWKSGDSSIFAFNSSIVDWVDSGSVVKMSLRKGMVLVSLSTTMFEESTSLVKELQQCVASLSGKNLKKESNSKIH